MPAATSRNGAHKTDPAGDPTNGRDGRIARR